MAEEKGCHFIRHPRRISCARPIFHNLSIHKGWVELAEKTFIPLYKKIYASLKEKIAAGTYRPGDRLPCERELCGQYGVERVTVRKALQLLSEDGLIEKRTGIGSFVTSSKPELGREEPENRATILFVMRQNENDIQHNTMSCNTKLYFAMEEICRRNGYLLSYIGISDETDLEALVAGHPVAGLFLVSSYQDRALDAIAHMDIPALLLNHRDPRYLSIMPDNDDMLKQVIRHLKEMGHRRIAYIDGMPDSCNAKERWEGFRIAMHLEGLSVNPDLYYVGNWTYEGGRLAAQQILKAESLPTAIFAASDMMAAGAMEEFKRAGIRIPEEISIVGYDNLDIDSLLSPPLTSAMVDFSQMCQIAFEHLLRICKTGHRAEDHYVIRIPARLITRSSVSALPPQAPHPSSP